jgi:hypothetical protein
MRDIGVWDRPGSSATRPTRTGARQINALTQDTLGYKGSLSRYHQNNQLLESLLLNSSCLES